MSEATSIDGIRDGHLVRTTVSRQAGRLAISREHRPDCPCQARDSRSARIARRRKPTRPAT